MKNIGIIIQARTGSSRLPNKVTMPFYKIESIFEIIVSRIKKSSTYKIVLATTNKSSDDVLVKLANKLGIDFFRGSEENVLERFIQCAENFKFETIVRVCSDNPFIDVQLMNDLIISHVNSSTCYSSYKTKEGVPAIRTHYGVFSEVVELSALKKVQQITEEKLYQEHVTNYIYSHSKDFVLNLLPMPYYIESSNSRLTLDSPEDWDVLKRLYEKCNNIDKNFSTEIVMQEIPKDKASLEIMRQQINKFSK